VDWWLLGEASHLTPVPVGAVVLGALLLGRGTAAGSKLGSEPRCNGDAAGGGGSWGVAASFDKLGVSKPAAAWAWVALFQPGGGPALLTPARVSSPGQWQPLKRLEPGRQSTGQQALLAILLALLLV